MKHFFLVALIFCTSSCTDVLGVQDVLSIQGIESYKPAEIFEIWWDEVEQCTKLEGSYGEINWYLATNIPDPFAGYWFPPHDIYLQRGFETDRPLVKHEMIHDLHQRGSRLHGSPFFEDCV